MKLFSLMGAQPIIRQRKVFYFHLYEIVQLSGYSTVHTKPRANRFYCRAYSYGVKIELNCDMGEGCANEGVLMPFFDACNIACGGHYGNEQTITKAISLALDHGLKIGAHPSYPDRQHFGRAPMHLSCQELTLALARQLDLFCAVCEKRKVVPNHVKLHGALYHAAWLDESVAHCVVQLLRQYPYDWEVYTPPNSALHHQARGILTVREEAFADRRYDRQGKLLPRSHPKAIITQPDEAEAQCRSIIFDQVVATADGATVPLRAQTLCIHSDNPNALALAQRLRQCLDQWNAHA